LTFLFCFVLLYTDSCDLNQIIKGVQALPIDSKARFAGVSVIASHIGSGRLLVDFPDLVHWLLSSTQEYATAPHVSCFNYLIEYPVITNLVCCKFSKLSKIIILCG
jgi:hypothetical protein